MPNPSGKQTSRNGVKPVEFSVVCRDELTEIAKRLPRPFSNKAKTKRNLTGLSLSGGGIRSACFNLGLLEGLDRLTYTRPDNSNTNGQPSANGKSFPAKTGDAGDRSHLEFFDYVSSVSGGGCAAGHLATAMLPEKDDPQRLGDVALTSKTVPGWLWGLGVWFLGTVFQLLKTGAFLVGVLAVVAFCMRVFDAPSASAFCAALGSDSDVTRGFAPFWITLWVFLVGYGFYVWSKDRWASYWFGYATLLAFIYVLVVSHYHDDHLNRPALWFLFHYGMLLALVCPGVLMCLVIVVGRGGVQVVRRRAPRFARWLAWRSARLGRRSREFIRWCVRRFARWLARCSACLGGRSRWFIRRLARRSRHFSRWLATSTGKAASRRRRHHDDAESRLNLRSALLVPLLVGMLCFAALVTTGDIEFRATGDDLTQVITAQDKSQWYGKLGDSIYLAAWVALGLTSLGLAFPRSLLQSARQIEEHGATGRGSGGSWFKSRGWEPVFRVVVFLCSYGVVLLVLFLIFSTVAREDVSGYFDWRKDLPLEAFHFTDFRDSELAWGQIVHDALPPPPPSPSPESKLKPPNVWTPLARKLIEARTQACVTLNEERNNLAELRLLDSLPWINRVLGPLAKFLPMTAWKKNGYDVDPSSERHYESIATKTRNQRALASAIANHVLNAPDLYQDYPKEAVTPESYLQKKLKVKWDPARYEGLYRRYREWERVLEAALLKGPAVKDTAAFQSAVRNYNRYALSLYLPVIMRDRRDHVVFSSIVWVEDQWTRLRIAVVALVIWTLCCAVDVNTFSLHAFYRDHVIDEWVKVPRGNNHKRFLYETEQTYRGHKSDRKDQSTPRRAPLLLFNATLEGNRWLGQEPELSRNIFEFSPIASGSGATKFWRRRETVLESPGERTWILEFARRNRLDIGQIVAISGAFLAPGTVANPALSAVLHLLNIQTGSWVRDPRKYENRSLWESLKFHACQSLGVDDEGDSRYMLTDGAHVENLGLYSLLRRRCTLIVASDCSQEDRSEKDAGRRLNALVQVLQQASVDGVEIGPFLSSRAFLDKDGEVSQADDPTCRHKRSTGLSLVLPAGSKAGGKEGDVKKADGNVVTVHVVTSDSEKPKQPDEAEKPPAAGDPKLSPAGRDEVAAGLNLSREHFVFAWITYPEGARGLLVYLRPTLTGDEGDALLHGAAGAAFPDDDPMDQFYSPSKMNTYRLLGRHIAVELMHDPVMTRVLLQLSEGQPIGSTPLVGEPGCQEYCGASPPSCLGRVPRPFRPTRSAVVADESP